MAEGVVHVVCAAQVGNRPGACTPAWVTWALSLPTGTSPRYLPGPLPGRPPHPAVAYASEVKRVVSSAQEKGREGNRIHAALVQQAANVACPGLDLGNPERNWNQGLPWGNLGVGLIVQLRV